MHISGEDEFGIFAGSRDNRLDFVGREVLSFVHNKDDIRQGATPNVGQWRHQYFLVGHHLINLLEVAIALAKLVLDELQVVPKGLHVGIDFLLGIAGQKSDVAVAQEGRWDVPGRSA